MVTQVEKPISHGTLSALRSPNFRLYFGGQIVSISGTWMQAIAQSYLVFQITKSELWLGIVACAAGLPLVLLSPLGGVAVERIPRRTMLRFTQAAQMVLAFILAALAFAGTIQVWHIVVLAVLLGITNALDVPARQTFIVEMVGREDLSSGIALNSIVNALGRVLGPTAAGIALVQFGPAWCFFLNGVSFLAVLASLFVMKVPFAIASVSRSSPVRQLLEGLEFVRRDALIPPLLLLAAVGGFFVLPILRLLPAVADVMLHSPAEGYAAVSAAEGVGSMIGGIIVAQLSQKLGHGRVLAVAVVVNAIANIVLAMQTQVPAAVVVTAFFGTSMILLLVSLNTGVQTVVPDLYRARVMSLYTLALLGTSPFGALTLGAIGDAIGIDKALILNGICIAVLSGVIFMRWPQLLRQDSLNETALMPDQAAHPAVGD